MFNLLDPLHDAARGSRRAFLQAGASGGGMGTDQVIGATDRYGMKVVARPVLYEDVTATLYHNLGIDPAQTTLTDPAGRPQHIVNQGRMLREVV